MTENIKNTEEQELPKFNNELIYEASRDALTLSNGKCGACERTGFPIFLVRKAIVPKYFKKDIVWSQGMLNLGDSRDAPNELNSHHYAYRTLREGYVYILLEKRPVKEWNGTNLNLLKVMNYEVTNSGAFRLREFRDSQGSRPKELPKTSCLADGHHLKAKFITVDNKIYQKAWIAYSPFRWEKETIEFYRQNKTERDLRFTIIDLSKNDPIAQTKSYQKRSFPFSDFMSKAKYLLELECNSNEVVDYFDVEQQEEIRKKIRENLASGKSDDIGSVKKDIAKGVFYTKNINLNEISDYSTEEIYSIFDNLFCTASHFNSLLDKDRKIVSAFQSVIDSYRVSTEGDANKLNTNYQTNDISAVLIEDSFGLAEELSVQRRQLLAPIANGLVGTSTDQVLAIQQALDRQLKSKSDITKEEIVRSAGEEMKYVNPVIAEAMYEENILDLSYNRTYKEIYKMSDSLRYEFPVMSWLGKKISQGCAQLFGARATAIDNYFTNQKTLSKNKPLLYFKPETAFARTQYTNINVYKEIIKSEKTNENASACQFFCFYFPTAKTDPRQRKFAYQQASDLFIEAAFKDDDSADIKFLDSIRVVDVVGDVEYAKENGYDLDESRAFRGFDSDVNLNFYFRYVRERGCSIRRPTPPLGEYKKVNITDAQKKKILEIYKANSKRSFFNEIDVVVVEFPDAKEQVAEWKKNEQWEQKEGEKIYNDSIDSYESLNKVVFNNLQTYVKEVSTDYFMYLLWLFDEKNNVQFWLKECEPNTSDIHINALSNLLMVLDNDYMGTLYLEGQAQLWAALLNYKSSIYFHLIEGSEFSLFNIASGNIPDEYAQLTTKAKAILAKTSGVPYSNNEPPKIDHPMDGLKSVLDKSQSIANLNLTDNVTIGAHLKEELIKLSLSNVAKSLSNNNKFKLDRKVVNKHLLKAMNMYSTGCFKEYKVSVAASNLNDFIDNIGGFAPTVIPKNGKLVTSNGKNIRYHYSANSQTPYLNKKDINKATGESVNLSVIVTFPDDEARKVFEEKLTSNNGHVKAEKFNSTSIVSYEELQSAKYQAKKAWREDVYDTSISGVINLFTLAYLHIQTSLLQDEISKLRDQNLIDKLQKDLTKAYIESALAVTEWLIITIKLGALFIAKDKTLYELLGKVHKGFGYIGKAIAIVDSFGDLCNASSALKRGDSHSFGFMISSTISFVAAGLGILMAIPTPWSIVLFLAPFVINWIFGAYDDASSWDGMDRWMNCCLFGKFDHGDLFPPYPISDTGNYLSEQDYYLASRKGRCSTLHYEINYYELAMKEDNLFGQDPYKSSKQAEYYNLHLQLNLPDYDVNKSHYEARVTIHHKEDTEQDTILTITPGDESIVIDPTERNKDYFLPADKRMYLKEHILQYRYKQDTNKSYEYDKTDQQWLMMKAIVSGEDEITIQGRALDLKQREAPEVNFDVKENNLEQQEQQVGLFVIDQLLGRVLEKFSVICIVKYWPNGRVDQENQPLFPFILSHQYDILTTGEYISKKIESVQDVFE